MSQIPEFLKTDARSTFGRNIPWKMIDFFRAKNGFKKMYFKSNQILVLILNWN